MSGRQSVRLSGETACGHAGTVALRRPLARQSGDLTIGSDRQGQLLERDGQPPARWLLDRQLVVSTPQVLH
jgi:hypothetical protein